MVFYLLFLTTYFFNGHTNVLVGSGSGSGRNRNKLASQIQGFRITDPRIQKKFMDPQHTLAARL